MVVVHYSDMSDQIVLHLFELLNVIGLIVFAISGALFAAEKNMDILGLMLIGTVTGIGGGTLRDVMLGIYPVSWVQEPISIYICLAACTFTYFFKSLHLKRLNIILWMDAIGLSAFAVLGTDIALHHQSNPIIAIVMGVMSATFGGILRDVLCAKMLILMRPELYITCALLASFVYVLMNAFGFDVAVSQVSGFVAGFLLRASAILWKLEIPRFGYERI